MASIALFQELAAWQESDLPYSGTGTKKEGRRLRQDVNYWGNLIEEGKQDGLFFFEDIPWTLRSSKEKQIRLNLNPFTMFTVQE